MALSIGPGITFGGGITIQDESPINYANETLYDTPGTYSWTAPAGVTLVSVACIGGGGAGTRGQSPSVDQYRRGGGGGGLGWKNNIAVTPGELYTVVVGAGGDQELTFTSVENGGPSFFISANVVAGLGGQGGSTGSFGDGSGYGGGYVGDGGGTGGRGGLAAFNPLSVDDQYPYVYRVGGGAGGSTAGYTGNGGNGGTDGSTTNSSNSRYIITPTAGAGGGSGGSWNDTPTNFVPNNSTANQYSFGAGSGGSGTGIYGAGSSGGYWKSSTQEYIMSGPALAYGADAGKTGEPGSDGGPILVDRATDGNGYGVRGVFNSGVSQIGGDGGNYGAGGGAVGPTSGTFGAGDRIGYGAKGAVRIIWGAGRSYPDNAGPITYRSLLSPAGQSAYDATAVDDWFEVSAADYASVQSGILQTTTTGMTAEQLAQTPDGSLPANKYYTLPYLQSVIPSGYYILGLVVRPDQPDGTTWSFKPYVGTVFKSGTWTASLGTNSLTVSGTGLKYFLRKDPTSPSNSTLFLAMGPSTPDSGALNWAALSGFETGALGVGSSPQGDPNLQGWTSYTPGFAVYNQWLYTPASYQW